MLHLLGLANKYDFSALQQTVTAYLKATLTVSNVCIIYNVASFYLLKELSTACADFIDVHAQEVMKSESFLLLSQSALAELLERDSFYAQELDIYYGLLKWLDHHKENAIDAGELLKLIRLQLIPINSLLDEVRPSGYFRPDDILDAICLAKKGPGIDLRQRGMLSKLPHRACILSGPCQIFLRINQS